MIRKFHQSISAFDLASVKVLKCLTYIITNSFEIKPNNYRNCMRYAYCPYTRKRFDAWLPAVEYLTTLFMDWEDRHRLDSDGR